MEIPQGPLAYKSQREPSPLTLEEEALLAYAATGFTGPVMADLCFAKGQGGSMLAGLAGRTIASGDAIQTVALVVINDEGTWLVRRPREVSPETALRWVELGNRGAFEEWYREARVQLSDQRTRVSSDPIFNLNINRWAAHAQGTTLFLPINDLTLIYINGLLEIFGEETAAFVLDDRANYLPAGLGKFAASRGGHLDDDLAHGKVVAVKHVETMVAEFVAVEQGMMLQNLGLMADALGLGGYPSFANHEFGWFEALGFQMGKVPASQYLGVNPLVKLGMKLMGQDLGVPYPQLLERDGEVLLKPYCPPAYASMELAVHSVVDAKFGPQGVFGKATAARAWQEAEKVHQSAERPSELAIAATVAYCEYLQKRYGRFPAIVAPYRTVVGFQACRLDTDFYDRFYQPGALRERHRKASDSRS